MCRDGRPELRLRHGDVRQIANLMATSIDRLLTHLR